MNARQWARVKEIFHAVVEQEPRQRAEFVALACQGDTTIQVEIERLLAAHGSAGGFLEPHPSGALDGVTMSGQRIGRYEIGRLLGSGGMGQVYAARDVELGREVAIKIAQANQPDSRLRREAQHAARLNHPHICTIHEVGSSDGRTYIAMEYVAGECLCDVIPPEGLPLEKVVQLGAQIADALVHAHEEGIVHRDLKSANVMVTRDGRAKVLDFGLARAAAAVNASDMSAPPLTVTAPGTVSGTLAYMAPELLRGRPANAASDTWAAGVLLYELACGVRPFGGATAFELSAAILQHPMPRSARIPSSLHQIIDRCLAKNPSDRYASARELSSALTTLQASRAASMQGQVGRANPLRLLRTARAVFALCVVVAAAAGVVTWWSNRGSRPVGLGAAGRPAIAVMWFDNVTGADDTAWLSQVVPNMLLTGLAQTRGLDIVSMQRLREVVRQMGATDLESVRHDQFSELARRAGAGAIVVGGIFKTGSDVRIDAQLEDLGTGRILTAQSVRGSDVFLLVDQLAARIRDDIGLRAGDGIRDVAEVSTASLDAFRLYAQGVDAFVNYHWEGAEPLLQRAVAIDPNFADAYLHLAHVNFFLGRPGLQQEYLRRAAEHANRLSARQRLVLDIESARVAGDGPKAARVLDQLIETFPDDEDAYNIGIQLYEPVNGLVYDPQKLLIIVARGAAAVPTSTLTRNIYAYGLLGTGRYEDALTEFRRNVDRASRLPNPYDSLAEGRMIAGDPAGAIDTYGRALAIDPTFAGSHEGRAWAFAMLGRFDEALAEAPPPIVRAFLLSRIGRHREATRIIEDAGHEATINGDVAEQGHLLLVSALLALERRDYTRALQACEAAEEVFMRLPPALQRVRIGLVHTLEGITLVAAGRRDDARAHVVGASRLFNPAVETENWWLKALEGEMALAAGDPAAAAVAFSAGQSSRVRWFDTLRMSLTILANHLTSRDGLARVAQAQHDPARAIQIYRQLLSSGPKQKFVSVFEPRYALAIARLLEQTGDTQGALREYRRFQDLWVNADADAPEISEAHRAVARLSVPLTGASSR
jgi:tetratricopeptide (TPR) repeat protein/predicted Ser/Thr protein kinase